MKTGTELIAEERILKEKEIIEIGRKLSFQRAFLY